MDAARLQADLFRDLGTPFTGEALFDCFSDLVFFLKNARGQYVVVNQTLVDRCGLRTKAELIGRTPDQVHPPPLGQSYRRQDEAVLRTGEPILNRLELHLFPSGGQGWCLTNKLPLLNRAGQVVGLMGVSKDLQTPNDRGADYSQLAAVVRHIQDHFDEPLKVPALAARAGLSPYQFEQRIRGVFQLTAGQFIQKVRMDAAVRLLRHTAKPIAVIAQDCGYADQSAFSRQFKLTVGLSPAQFRRARPDSPPDLLPPTA